eukprot:TRINITY_DN9987_c0_g1_i1.p1 TRINITY_DN9987_c0_g1~~TRINITY_DN9987_c0_g1_i1.p1  ORF type:complete len:1157 (-),score=141.63 TRINITY_DN9987_c0_g1_i1:14-3484(-)
MPFNFYWSVFSLVLPFFCNAQLKPNDFNSVGFSGGFGPAPPILIAANPDTVLLYNATSLLPAYPTELPATVDTDDLPVLGVLSLTKIKTSVRPLEIRLTDARDFVLIRGAINYGFEPYKEIEFLAAFAPEPVVSSPEVWRLVLALSYPADVPTFRFSGDRGVVIAAAAVGAKGSLLHVQLKPVGVEAAECPDEKPFTDTYPHLRCANALDLTTGTSLPKGALLLAASSNTEMVVLRLDDGENQTAVTQAPQFSHGHVLADINDVYSEQTDITLSILQCGGFQKSPDRAHPSTVLLLGRQVAGVWDTRSGQLLVALSAAPTGNTPHVEMFLTDKAAAFLGISGDTYYPNYPGLHVFVFDTEVPSRIARYCHVDGVVGAVHDYIDGVSVLILVRDSGAKRIEIWPFPPQHCPGQATPDNPLAVSRVLGPTNTLPVVFSPDGRFFIDFPDVFSWDVSGPRPVAKLAPTPDIILRLIWQEGFIAASGWCPSGAQVWYALPTLDGGLNVSAVPLPQVITEVCSLSANHAGGSRIGLAFGRDGLLAAIAGGQLAVPMLNGKYEYLAMWRHAVSPNALGELVSVAVTDQYVATMFWNVPHIPLAALKVVESSRKVLYVNRSSGEVISAQGGTLFMSWQLSPDAGCFIFLQGDAGLLAYSGTATQAGQPLFGYPLTGDATAAFPIPGAPRWLLAVAQHRHAIWVYEVGEDCRLLRWLAALPTERAIIQTLQFTPDGKLLVARDDGTLTAYAILRPPVTETQTSTVTPTVTVTATSSASPSPSSSRSPSVTMDPTRTDTLSPSTIASKTPEQAQETPEFWKHPLLLAAAGTLALCAGTLLTAAIFRRKRKKLVVREALTVPWDLSLLIPLVDASGLGQPYDLVVAQHWKVTGPLLGRGGFASVYKGAEIKTGEPVAIKVMESVDAMGHTGTAAFQREVAALTKLHHPNIVRLLGHARVVSSESESLCLVLEMIPNGCLEALRSTHGPIRMPLLQHIACDILSALDYLHSEGIAHLDLKPANILLDYDQRCRVSDFGLARAFSRTASASAGNSTHTASWHGTLQYTPPEHLTGPPTKAAKPHMASADIWAFGLVIIRLASLVPLWQHVPNCSLAGLAVHIVNKRTHPVPEDFRSAHPTLAALAASCLQPEPMQRPSARQLLSSIIS